MIRSVVLVQFSLTGSDRGGMGSQGFRVLLFGADLVLVSAMERLLLSQSDEFKKSP
ncbi:hypothetical protein SynA1825c_02177 [Synechococcus sp. A18-25c]|nr:hypothetical protein SynA1825c_02177 [Synechococcus sp. A18-25c]